jgi:hypothetical protein
MEWNAPIKVRRGRGREGGRGGRVERAGTLRSQSVLWPCKEAQGCRRRHLMEWKEPMEEEEEEVTLR